MSQRLKQKTILWLAILTTCLLGVIAVGYYHVAVLEPQAHTYMSSLSTSVSHLKKSCNELALKTEVLLFEKPSATQSEIQANIKTLTKLSSQTRAELNGFKNTSDELRILPFPITSVTYQKSMRLKDQSGHATDQVKEVLDEYDNFLTFLSHYYPAQIRLNDELEAFNAISDLNTLQYDTFRLDSVSTTLQAQGDELLKLPPPQGLGVFIQRFAAANTQSAQGFEALALAFSPPVDSKINEAAKKLEAAAEENDLIRNELFGNSIENTPVLKHISELSEKFARFKF